MKKIILIIILSFLGIVAAGSVLAATTFSFSPANINAVQGENFNLIVAINPQVKIYTSKLELNYPADLLEMNSFSFGNNWMPLVQSGYDLFDNTNGILIKTAGFPGGLSFNATFGTISFRAKKTGSGIIKIGNNSLALNTENQNVLSGMPQTIFSIQAISVPQVVSQPAPTETSVPSIVLEEAIPEEEEISKDETIISLTEPVGVQEETSFMAGIIGLIMLGTDNSLVGIVVVLVLIILIYFAIKGIYSRKRKIDSSKKF